MVLPFLGLVAEKELPPEEEIQDLALDKHKCRCSPPEEPEAQAMPWANKLEGCTITFYDICVECCGKTDGIHKDGKILRLLCLDPIV